MGSDDAVTGFSGVGEDPVGWRTHMIAEHRRRGYPTITEWHLRPDTGEDFFSEPLGELGYELQDGLRSLREEVVVEVGPTVTCRGKTICEPALVPLDPQAHARWRLRQAWNTMTAAFTTIASASKTTMTHFVSAANELDKLIKEDS